MGRGNYVEFLLFALEIQLVDYVRRVVLLEALEFFLADQLVLPEVEALLLPLLALGVVDDEFAVWLVIREEAELAVAIEAR